MSRSKHEAVRPSPGPVGPGPPPEQKANGDASKERQNLRMRAVMFWVFIGLFVAVCTCTMLAVFAGVGHPTEDERNVLFTGFIVEVGVVIVALFAHMFGLREKLTRQTTDDESPANATRHLLGGLLSDFDTIAREVRETRAAAEGIRGEPRAGNVEETNPGRPRDYWETIVESVSAAQAVREAHEDMLRDIRRVVSANQPDDFGSVAKSLSEIETLLSAGSANIQRALDGMRGCGPRGQSNGG